MPTFAIHHITEIQGKVNIYKLEKDGIILFDLYEMEIARNKSISGQLKSIQTTLHRIANNYEIPETKYKKLLGCNDDYTEYEIKTTELRLYLFKEHTTGSIIVIGGKKSTQKEDIRNFRNIKQQYINSKS